jgi:DNA-binding transcriptional LysR family regulator
MFDPSCWSNYVTVFICHAGYGNAADSNRFLLTGNIISSDIWAYIFSPFCYEKLRRLGVVTTFIQLEAFVAVADMGSFDAAARRLNVAQSAVSRQIREFEERFHRPLFDRSSRSARLTIEGVEVLALARTVLRERDILVAQFSSDETLERSLAIGVTELAALTWLPKFIEALRASYPLVKLRLEVDMAGNLYEQVRQGRADLVIVPNAFRATEMQKTPLATVRCGWYCSPSYAEGIERIDGASLAEMTLLTQGAYSGAGILMKEWLVANGVQPRSSLACNSLSALGGMASAGLGLASLPAAVARELVTAGLLREVHVTPTLPRMQYVALIRLDTVTPFHKKVVGLARTLCDYETSYQDARHGAARQL